MIAALILGLIGLGLVLSHSEPWIGDFAAVFLICPAMIWLLLGGGERWLARREKRHDA